MQKWVFAVAMLGCVSIGAHATPVQTGGIAIPGAMSDGTGTSANDGRLGFFSDLYYDAKRNEWWALSDRGPGGGTIPFETRVVRFTLDINKATGAIANFRPVEVVKFKDHGGAFNGIAPKPKNVQGLSLDPEGFVVAPNGSFYVSDEYGPSVLEFTRQGELMRRFETPANIIPRNAAGEPNFADDKGNVAGRRSNRGFEGLAITPDGKFLFAILQSAMLDEGGKEGSTNRLVKFDTKTGKAVAQYAYEMDRAGQGRGVSALVALNDHQFLVLERNNRGVGVGAELNPPDKRVYKIDVGGATDISGKMISQHLAFEPATKSLWLDLSKARVPGLYGKTPEKIEGLAFGPKLKDGSTLLLAGTDNDFSVSQNGSGTQFDVYFKLDEADPDESAIQCPLDQKTGCTRVKDNTPAELSPGYTLLPGILFAFKVVAGE
ncbi:hypothetical protein FHS83_002246 [Rhizomicrobium palustre]|uniref:Phytase-like domain-containing protein n=1 Tax=Rhizomicrobium palustre TaxID=189966 RepID=A0A846MZ75_9PROT|nr:esterase-like activity of phytase family protein [Rhizomicrobium palustre]NIK88928.1 hypothetical protein [Rhizomicrobium palustre]